MRADLCPIAAFRRLEARIDASAHGRESFLEVGDGLRIGALGRLKTRIDVADDLSDDFLIGHCFHSVAAEN